MNHLPLEPLSLIFECCDAKSLVALSLTSPYLRSCVQINRGLYCQALIEVFFPLSNYSAKNCSVAQLLNRIAGIGDQIDLDDALRTLDDSKTSQTPNSTPEPFHNSRELHNNVLVNPDAQLDSDLYNFTNPIAQHGAALTWLVKEHNWITVYGLSLRSGTLQVLHRQCIDWMQEFEGTLLERNDGWGVGRGHLGYYYMTPDTHIFQEHLWLKKVGGQNGTLRSIMLPVGYSLPGVGVQKLQRHVNNRYSYARLDSRADSAWFLLDWNRSVSLLLFKTEKYSDSIDLHPCESGAVYISSSSGAGSSPLRLYPRVSERAVSWHVSLLPESQPKSFLHTQFGCVVREGEESLYLKHKGSILIVGTVGSASESSTTCWKFTRPFLSKLDSYVKRCFPVWKPGTEDWKVWQLDVSGFFYPCRRRTR